MKRQYRSILTAGLIILLLLAVASCKKQSDKEDSPSQSTEKEKKVEIAVFIPGVLEGSPTYIMMADGTKQAAEETGSAEVTVIEGGFNQGEWMEKMLRLASSEAYTYIVTSNPAMPEICQEISEQYPDQRFICFDGTLKEEHPSIYTYQYNQMEQAYLIGHLAALITSSSLTGANNDLKIGLIAGQEYPDMLKAIRPGFELGAMRVNPAISVEYRVLGNWYDAEKAADLARSMIREGVDVILPIAGGANQGVLNEAQAAGIYVVWYDHEGYDIAPGTILGSTGINAEEISYETVKKALNGELAFGENEIGSVYNNGILFFPDNPLYLKEVPSDIRAKQAELYDLMKNGSFKLGMPVF